MKLKFNETTVIFARSFFRHYVCRVFKFVMENIIICSDTKIVLLLCPLKFTLSVIHESYGKYVKIKRLQIITITVFVHQKKTLE